MQNNSDEEQLKEEGSIITLEHLEELMDLLPTTSIEGKKGFHIIGMTADNEAAIKTALAKINEEEGLRFVLEENVIKEKEPMKVERLINPKDRYVSPFIHHSKYHK